MVCYVIPKHEVKAVEAGSVTLDFARASNKRHAKVGERMALLSAKANKKVARIATPVCVFRATLTITAEGLTRAINIAARGPWGEQVGFLVRGAEDGAPPLNRDKALQGLAERAGFKDWAALFEDCRRRAMPRPLKTGRLSIELVGWGPLE